MCVYIKQEKIYKFILYRIMKVIFFFWKWFFLPVSTSPLGNKGKDKTNQKSPGPQSFSSVLWKHLATRRLCDVSPGSVPNFCSEICLQASISQENAATKSCSSSFDWFFCSWGLRTLGGGENSSWGYISSGPRGYHCSWVLILTQCPRHCRVSLCW